MSSLFCARSDSSSMMYYNPYVPEPEDSNRASPAGGEGLYMTAVSSALIVVNGPLLKLAYDDQSWGALGIMLAGAPIANAGALVFFLLFNLFIARHSSGLRYVVAVGFPIIALIIDWIFISSLNLHGC